MFGVFLIILFLLVNKPVFAASTGGIFLVDREQGVVGWAQETSSVNIYISNLGEGADKAICQKGGIPVGTVIADESHRFGNKSESLFVYNSDCLKELIDGKYSISVAIGPNLFTADSPVHFSIKTINTDTKIWIRYIGTVISRKADQYDSYPTVMFDEDKYKMWYVSPEYGGDAIFYAESDNGINWQLINGAAGRGTVLHKTLNSCDCTTGICPAGENFSDDDMHVADPSVIKVDNKYYMYYTGASKAYGCFGTHNKVFVATSDDGINWKKGSDGTA